MQNFPFFQGIQPLHRTLINSHTFRVYCIIVGKPYRQTEWHLCLRSSSLILIDVFFLDTTGFKIYIDIIKLIPSNKGVPDIRFMVGCRSAPPFTRPCHFARTQAFWIFLPNDTKSTIDHTTLHQLIGVASPRSQSFRFIPGHFARRWISHSAACPSSAKWQFSYLRISFSSIISRTLRSANAPNILFIIGISSFQCIARISSSCELGCPRN